MKGGERHVTRVGIVVLYRLFTPTAAVLPYAPMLWLCLTSFSIFCFPFSTIVAPLFPQLSSKGHAPRAPSALLYDS